MGEPFDGEAKGDLEKIAVKIKEKLKRFEKIAKDCKEAADKGDLDEARKKKEEIDNLQAELKIRGDELIPRIQAELKKNNKLRTNIHPKNFHLSPKLNNFFCRDIECRW